MVLKRAQGATQHAHSFRDAARGVPCSSSGSGPLTSAASTGSERLAALFAALHKAGATDCCLGTPRGSGAATPSAPASRRSSLSGGGAAGGARRGSSARVSGEDLAELILQPSSLCGDGEGPLSRSLSMGRQRSAAAADVAQLVGCALDQVPEGEREGLGERACAGRAGSITHAE